MINVIKNKHIIEVTKSAYEKVYKGKGYVPYNKDNVGRKKEEKPSIKDLTKVEIIKKLEEKPSIKDLTKVEIIKKLEEKGIEHDSTALKSDLAELLRSDK